MSRVMSRAMSRAAPLAVLALLIGWIECTHIFTLDKDFSKLKSDPELAKYVEQVLNRLHTFKVAVHPRIRLFYHLLKRNMINYAHRTEDSLYMPYVYRERQGQGGGGGGEGVM